MGTKAISFLFFSSSFFLFKANVDEETATDPEGTVKLCNMCLYCVYIMTAFDRQDTYVKL